MCTAHDFRGLGSGHCPWNREEKMNLMNWNSIYRKWNSLFLFYHKLCRTKSHALLKRLGISEVGVMAIAENSISISKRFISLFQSYGMTLSCIQSQIKHTWADSLLGSFHRRKISEFNKRLENFVFLFCRNQCTKGNCCVVKVGHQNYTKHENNVNL